MTYKYDLFGWYDGLGEGSRSTDLDPVNLSVTTTPGEMRANWTGFTWNDMTYVAPPTIVPAPPPEDAWAWFIDIGPFFDRFGASKMALLTSANTTVKALVTDLSVRKWVDLKRPDVGAGLDALVALGVPGVDASLKAAILTTPVTDEENMALRRVYFS